MPEFKGHQIESCTASSCERCNEYAAMTAESWPEVRKRLEKWRDDQYVFALVEKPALRAALTRIDDLEKALRNAGIAEQVWPLLANDEAMEQIRESHAYFEAGGRGKTMAEINAEIAALSLLEESNG